jgi:fructosamine-3-kinase
MSFVKPNNTSHPDHLLCEAAGLAALQHQLKTIDSPIRIPHVLAVDQQQLTLERINAVSGSRQQWLDFGQHLAIFHQCRQLHSGWSDHNYIGLNPQANGWHNDWGQFFYQQRLSAQVQMITDRNQQDAFQAVLTSCQSALIDCLNQTTSHLALLHGDLWSGNVLFDQQSAWLIDPAVYCGDPEADLAMTELFGGFPGVFYQGYRSVSPLSADYALKKIIYNLYHQLNHFNLFGSGYLTSCEQAFAIIKQQFTC